MHRLRSAPALFPSRSCFVKDGFNGFAAGSVFSAGAGLLELLRWLFRLSLLLEACLFLFLFFFLCLCLSEESLLLLVSAGLSLLLLDGSRTGLGLGLRSQSPAAQRSYPLMKLGHPSWRADFSCVRKRSSFFIMTSTSFVPVLFAMENMELITSRSLALRRKTCCCEGQGSIAISDEDAEASSRSCSDVSCRARKICSKMKKPQSWDVSCCGTPGRQIAASSR
mmetsp:Transcript_28713/g.52308  ORF Transcript_28713/g.52308 Transcript_28713/m.52308 type:complete len:223 (-) Transcript_28713:1017-1685(-)